MSQTELQRLLDECGYSVSIGAISKYEYGDRQPPAAFIYRASKCLQLNEDEMNALLQGAATDRVFDLLHEFQEIREREEGRQHDI